MPLPEFITNTPMDASFDKDIRDVHLVYDYDAQDAQGNPEKWRYEIWFFSENRMVYAIHGGPMAGRINYQTCTFQCIRPGELWQCNWLEYVRYSIHIVPFERVWADTSWPRETGTVVSLVYDIVNKKVTTLIAFSKGHWENADSAHGDKRNPEDFERWRGLAKVGIQTERLMLSEQAKIVDIFKGQGDLEPIAPDALTF